MITDEERQSIINEVVEKTLLLLPEKVGNLMMNQANMIKTNRGFYKKYPDLATNKDIVVSVIESIEGESPGIDYESLINRSVPLIRDRIKSVKGLDFKTVSRPNRDLSSLNIGLRSNHGDL